MVGAGELQDWPEDQLIAGAERLGLRLSPPQVKAFGRYLREILHWSARLNLTGFRRPEEIVREGFLDSLTCLTHIPSEARCAVDIGTGAGFPSIPLKIARPLLTFTLVEASRKKASFLRHVLRCLALHDVRVIQQRAERLAQDREETDRYDVAFARAVASPDEQARLVLPFLRPGGFFLAQVGHNLGLPVGGSWLPCEAFDVVEDMAVPREIGLPGRHILVLRRRA